MNRFLLYIIILFLLPMVSLYFFCKYFCLSWKWSFCFTYLLLNTGLFFMEWRLTCPGSLWLLLNACLPSLLGHLILKCPFKKTIIFSALMACILSVCNGFFQCLIFWYAAGLSPDTLLLKYLDAAQSLLLLFSFSLILLFITKSFLPSGSNNFYTIFLLFPILFISLTERTISDAIYGSTVIWDSKFGLIYPIVDHTQILFLQLFAGACLFAILFIWKIFTKSVLLEQQIQTQELYIREVCSRYEKTCSFRHDIQNHLTVLGELFHSQEFQEANKYLSHLEQTADALSCTFYTGIKAVDALLGSKLSLAAEHNIMFQCQLSLPLTEEITDMDWCILLSNALDNAIHASLLLPSNLRNIQISGTQKGNLYLLSIENSCHIPEGKRPPEGIGLSNIRTIVKKHKGTVQIICSESCFHLDILLHLQHISDQTHCRA